MVLQGRLLRCSEIGVDRAFNSYDYREKWKELDPDEVLSVSFLHEPVSVHPNSPVGMSYWREGGWFEGRSTTAPPPPSKRFSPTTRKATSESRSGAILCGSAASETSTLGP